MKVLDHKKRFLFFVILFLGFSAVGNVARSQTIPSIGDYSYLPPFLGTDVKPNILFLLGNSKTMNACAYPNLARTGKADCTNNTRSTNITATTTDYIATNTYSGYFEEGKCYRYSQNKFNTPLLKTVGVLSCQDKAITQQWDGNFLNWLTMRRIDIAKWVLTGGLCNSVRSSANSCATFRGQSVGTNNWDLKKQASFRGVGDPTFAISTADVRCVSISGGDFIISQLSTGACTASSFTGSGAAARTFNIRIDAGVKQTGVIQEIGEDKARFGLMLFNPSDGGKIVSAVADNFVTLIQRIENASADTETPLAEALYEASRYFAQIEPQYGDKNYPKPGADNDPYYFAAEQKPKTPAAWVECCKSFVLVFTDGAPTNDTTIIPDAIKDLALPHATTGHDKLCSDYYDPCTTSSGAPSLIPTDNRSHFLDDVAYWAHMTDLRPDVFGASITSTFGTTTITMPSTVTRTTFPDGGLPGMQNLNIYTFLAFTGGKGANLLKDTAKVGGFNDFNGNKIPDLQPEWDIKNNLTGAPGADGLPDTYFAADNAQEMRKNLLMALNDILQKSASGTAVSFLATSSTGAGASYQSYFYPTVSTEYGTAHWLGYLQALFLDGDGNLREDSGSNPDGRLVLTEDKIVITKYDQTQRETLVSLCTPHGTTGKRQTIQLTPPPNESSITDLTKCSSIGGMQNLKPLWEGGKLLAVRAPSTRTIHTSTDNATHLNFIAGNESTLRSRLRAISSSDSANIINFIRGEKDISNFRNRQTSVNGTSTGQTWKLGDIVNSSPVAVGAPAENLDRKYGDASYTAFLTKYQKRRQVVYVGANDGMLHAFNGGFFHSGDDKSTTNKKEHGYFTTAGPTGGETSHALGHELWGFIPQELLPHLQWLTGQDYDKTKHVFYVDGSPRITDARIFDLTGDPIHPNGWGTILIGSMRMGGGLIPVNLNPGRNNNTTDPGEDQFRSAYFVFDITDPEQRFGDPGNRLLRVFKDNHLGFTTSVPAIMRMNEGANGAADRGTWYAVFGSGPLTYRGERVRTSPTGNQGNKFESTVANTPSEFGQVYAVNLMTGIADRKQTDTTDRYAFMGDPSAFDLEADFASGKIPARDYIADSVYIGKTFGVAGAWKGKMHRILTNKKELPSGTNWTYSVLFDPQKPVLVAPTVAKDKLGSPWVSFGTGRLFSTGLNSDQQDISQQALYGIKEGVGGCWNTTTSTWSSSCTNTVLASSLYDATGVIVSTSTNIFALSDSLSTKGGWVLNLATAGERILFPVTLFSGIVAVPSYTPDLSSGACSILGSSSLYATFYETGTAYTSKNNPGPLGLSGGTTRTVLPKVDIGLGIASRVALVANENEVIAFTQTSSGDIVKLVIKMTPLLEGGKLFLEKSE